MLKNNCFNWKFQCISLALCVLFSQSSNGLDRQIDNQDGEAATSEKTIETVETTSDVTTSDVTTPDKKHHTPRAVNISKQTIQFHNKAPTSEAVICKREATIGSRIPKRSCKTIAELNLEILGQSHSGAGVKPKTLR